MQSGVFDELWFRLVAGLLIGPVLGSFVTMLSYRLPRRLSIVTPPSTCPRCQTRLGPRDLVPLFSWLFSAGRCRHCRAPISPRYPLIELTVTAGVMILFGLIGASLWLLPALLTLIGLFTALIIRIEDRG